MGEARSEVVSRLDISPLFVVALAPRAEVAVSRERPRGKTGYGDWVPEALCTQLERETPRIGLWIDTSDLSPEETVDQILLRRPAARVN